MNISISFFIELWIILLLVHSIKTSGTLKRLENTTETGDIDPEIVQPVTYNLDLWLANQTPVQHKQKNLIIIPVLALIIFLWFSCLKICKWIREDSKFGERGCSYDVTSFVILTQQDKDFNVLDMTTSPTTGVYDTVSSFRDLQTRIDTKMYDTVTSYASLLKQSRRQSPMDSKTFSANRSCTPDKDVKFPLNQLQYNKKGRFCVVPAFDNYVRLKNIPKEKDLLNSSMNSSRSIRSIKRGQSPLSKETSGLSTTLPTKRPKTENRRILGPKMKNVTTRDVAVQVNQRRTKRTNKTSKKTNSHTEVIRPNTLKLDNISLNNFNTDMHNKSCRKEICDHQTVLNNVFVTTALIHTSDAAQLCNGEDCSINSIKKSDEINDVSSTACRSAEERQDLLKSQHNTDGLNCHCTCNIISNNCYIGQKEANQSNICEQTKDSVTKTHHLPLDTSTSVFQKNTHCITDKKFEISENGLSDSFEICRDLKQTSFTYDDNTSYIDQRANSPTTDCVNSPHLSNNLRHVPTTDCVNSTHLSNNLRHVNRTLSDKFVCTKCQGHLELSSSVLHRTDTCPCYFEMKSE